MRVLKKKPGQPWEAAEVENKLEALQAAVGGHLESVTLWADACILCDEAGRYKGYAHNTTVCGVEFVGPILIVGISGEDFTDLTEQQEAALLAMGGRLRETSDERSWAIGSVAPDPGLRRDVRDQRHGKCAILEVARRQADGGTASADTVPSQGR